MTRATAQYSGGVRSGTTYLNYFRVTGGSGEVEITAELEDKRETATFPVEEGKLYRLSVVLRISSATRVTEQYLFINSLSSDSPRQRVVVQADTPGQPFYPLHLQGMHVDEYERPTPTPTPGLEDVAALIGELADSDEKVRRAAAQDLGYIGSGATDAVPALVETLRTDATDSVRQAAAGALAEIGAPVPEVVPALVEALGIGWGGLSIAAAEALGMFGPEARDAVPALVKMMLEARAVGEYEAAVDALGDIGPDAGDAVPALVDALDADGTYLPVRSHAAEALGKIGPGAREAVAALVETLGDEWSTVRVAAAGALRGVTGQDFGEDAAAWQRWEHEHRLPQFAVVLQNDDAHTFTGVITALTKSVSSIDTDGAERIARETDGAGRAVVVVCPRKQAEFYRDRIRTFGLDVTIEDA